MWKPRAHSNHSSEWKGKSTCSTQNYPINEYFPSSFASPPDSRSVDTLTFVHLRTCVSKATMGHSVHCWIPSHEKGFCRLTSLEIGNEQIRSDKFESRFLTATPVFSKLSFNREFYPFLQSLYIPLSSLPTFDPISPLFPSPANKKRKEIWDCFSNFFSLHRGDEQQRQLCRYHVPRASFASSDSPNTSKRISEVEWVAGCYGGR